MTEQRKRRGILFVLSAPSGAGKDTLLRALKPERFGVERIVTYTTRPRRPDEIDGVHYHFVDQARMRALEQANQLLECTEYSGNLYGTPRQAIEAALQAGHDVLIKPEVQGAIKVKAQFPDAVRIFLAPPSRDEALRRIRGRASESPQEVAARAAAMDREFAAAADYDYCVVNETGRLEEAVQRVAEIIAAKQRDLTSPPPTPRGD